MSSARRPFAVYAITRHGIDIAARIVAGLPGADLFASEKLAALAPPNATHFALPMGPTLVAEPSASTTAMSSSSASAPSCG